MYYVLPISIEYTFNLVIINKHGYAIDRVYYLLWTELLLTMNIYLTHRQKSNSIILKNK